MSQSATSTSPSARTASPVRAIITFARMHRARSPAMSEASSPATHGANSRSTASATGAFRVRQ